MPPGEEAKSYKKFYGNLTESSGREERTGLYLKRGLPGISDPSIHYVRQAPDSEPVFAVLEVPCIDLFRPFVLGISEAHGQQVLC